MTKKANLDVDVFEGKLIVDTTADTGERVCWIVSNDHAPNLQDMYDLLRRSHGRRVRITVEELPCVGSERAIPHDSTFAYCGPNGGLVTCAMCTACYTEIDLDDDNRLVPHRRGTPA